MSYDRAFQRTTTSRNRRPLYAPPTRGNQRQHSVMGYWVPLIVTGTIAIGGLAAWIWSERRDHDDDHCPHDKPPRPPQGNGPPGPQSYPRPPPQGGPPGPSGPPGPNQMPYQGPPPPGGEAASYYNSSETIQTRSTTQQQQEEGTWYGRVGGMMKRAPSPQQVLDHATKQMSAGVAAAGSALGSIWEGEESRDSRPDARSRVRRSGGKGSGRADEPDGFSDHERWSEEAEERTKITTVDTEATKRADSSRTTGRDGQGKSKAKRAIAIVVSANTVSDIDHDDQNGLHMEHASILSHLPTLRDSDNTDLYVLIYAPDLKSLPPADYKPTSTVPAVGSSYSQASTPAVTPGSELQSISPRIDPSEAPSRQFDQLYSQAQALVANSTQILPFTTSDGYIHILRHLGPQLVYVSDTVSGVNGEHIAQLKGWVGQTILVAGDEGHGGLADTETEDEGAPREKGRWYDHSSLIGLGKIEVVDAARVGEDWARRVNSRE